MFLKTIVKEYTIKLYQQEDFDLWNAFISTAKNATFLFHRDFMEYHTNRFEDYSLMVLDNEKLVAVLPANRVDDTVYSHQGLTYGGLVITEKTKLSSFILLFKSVLEFLNKNQITKLNIKPIPTFYCDYFSDELEYCLFLTKAKLLKKDALSVIDNSKVNKISKTRKESIRRGLKNGLIIKEESEFELFWNEILLPNLDKKHQIKPVHTAEEMLYLQSKFPDKIKHYNVYHNNKIVAGSTVFITKNVAHPQYVSGNEQKNELGSLDFLYDYLIHDAYKDKPIFDFNNSNENQGQKLNEGLAFWKETFGAKTVIQNFYEVETSNFNLLDTVLI